MHRFRMNWGAGGRRIETAEDHSIFVGDLAPDVTDELLFTTFSARFPSVRGAKARSAVARVVVAMVFADASVLLQVVMDPVTRMPKGFGFVRFTVKEEADQVRREL